MLPVAGLFVGLATLDLVYRVAEPPAAGQKLQALGQDLAAGGPAANAAVAFAALSRAAGAPAGSTTLVTALGRHPLAGQISAELADQQVDVVDATPGSMAVPPVSSAWVVQGSGERSVVSVNARAVDAGPPAALPELARAAPVLLVDGHHLRLALAAAAAARAAGRLVVLDGGSWKPGLDALLGLIDVAVCGADFRAPGTRSAPESAAELCRLGVPAVAVTAGPAPIRWWHAAAVPAAGAHPAGAHPASTHPAGARPASTQPAGARPASTVPAGEVPGTAGVVPGTAGVVAVRAVQAGVQPASAETAGVVAETAGVVAVRAVPAAGPAGDAAVLVGEVAVPVVTAVDTLGAGDAFHGAVAWAFATGQPNPPVQPGSPDRVDTAARVAGVTPAALADALGFAAAVAAVRCETSGPRDWLADPRLAALAAGWLAR